MSYAPDADTADNFDWTWAIIVKALPVLARHVAVPDGEVPKLAPDMARRVRRELHLIEALLRRLLVLLAMTMALPVWQPSASQNGGGKRPATDQQARATSAGHSFFPLFDPALRPARAPKAHQRPNGLVPRVRVIDIFAPSLPPVTPPPAPDPFAPRDVRPLAARIAAIQHVLDHPGQHVARMARCIVRLKNDLPDRRQAGARTSPLRHHTVPGASRKLHRAGFDDFLDLHQAACTALNSPLDSS